MLKAKQHLGSNVWVALFLGIGTAALIISLVARSVKQAHMSTPLLSIDPARYSPPDANLHSPHKWSKPFQTLVKVLQESGVEILGAICFAGGIGCLSWKIAVSKSAQSVRAFEQLAEKLKHNQIEVRLKGIEGLASFAIAHREDYWEIMNVLITFAKSKTHSHSRRISGDVQAALIVIGKRYVALSARQRLDFELAHLRGANLNQANFSDTDFFAATLNETSLFGTLLERSSLFDADLRKAILTQAILAQADLTGANLNRALLIRANLSDATLIRANLVGANLRSANLNRANLRGANLHGADFSGALNLTPAQIKSAMYWEKAFYDEDFRKQLNLSTETLP